MANFGWWYPAGAANDPNAPWNQQEPPCAVCGQYEDDCICPECPACGSVGDPNCYVDAQEHCLMCKLVGQDYFFDKPHVHPPSHGLMRSDEQIASKAKIEARLAEEAEGEALYATAEMLFDDFGMPTDRVVAMSPVERECWERIGIAMPRALRYSAQWDWGR